MGLFEGLAELLAPTRCAGCDLPGTLLCDSCRETLAAFDRAHACRRCGAPFGWLVCTECWAQEYAFEAALVLGELAAPLSRAVVLHKDGGERRLGGLLGKELGRLAGAEWGSWAELITWVPARETAVRRRGFDHGAEIARGAALVLGCEAQRLLAPGNARDQRLLGRDERAENASKMFSATRPTSGRVVLVDDVMTTGATADGASAALLEAGASAVRVVAVARAW